MFNYFNRSFISFYIIAYSTEIVTITKKRSFFLCCNTNINFWFIIDVKIANKQTQKKPDLPIFIILLDN